MAVGDGGGAWWWVMGGGVGASYQLTLSCFLSILRKPVKLRF